MDRFTECKRSIMTTHQCIDCLVVQYCDDPNAEQKGKLIRLEIIAAMERYDNYEGSAE